MSERRKEPLLKTFGGRVRHLRRMKRWTQEGLASRAGIDRSYIAGIEVGLRNPSLKVVAKVARGLSTSLSHLFEHVPATVDKK